MSLRRGILRYEKKEKGILENELKTSAKQFYLKDKDGKKVTASKLDKGDLPTLLPSLSLR